MDENVYKRQWTMENIDKFISLYREHECLWNSENESYKNVTMKNFAVEKLTTDMQMPGLTTSVVRDRIRSIRTMYRRELNKVIKSMRTVKNEKYIYKPRLFWFDKVDAFLRPLAMSRMDTANLGCPTSQTTEPNEDSEDNYSFQVQGVEDDLAEESSITEIEMDDNVYKRQWTMENIDKFISLYREHECLWNSGNESYKNATMKNSAVEKLMTDMHMPGLTTSVVKDRIKSIRTMYRRELNKVIKSMSTVSNEKYIYKPRLFWFDKVDAFLRPLAMLRMDTANLGCPTLLLNSQTTEPDEDCDDNFCFQVQGVEDDLAEESSTTEIEDHNQPSKSSSSVEPPHKKRKKSLDDLYTLPLTLPELQSLDNQSPDENEFDIFGKFIAAQLKKLPLISALQCQQKIQDLLTAKRIENLECENERRVSRIESSFSGNSPFSSSLDIDYEEKPNVNKDILYLEKD